MKKILTILACALFAGCSSAQLNNAETKGIAIVTEIDQTVQSGAKIVGVVATGVAQGAGDVVKVTANSAAGTVAATINQAATTTAHGAGIVSSVSSAVGGFATGFSTVLPPVTPATAADKNPFWATLTVASN